MTIHNPRSSSATVAHKTRKGFNLIEAAIVLAVVGGVIGGIWVAASAVRESYRFNDFVAGISYIAMNTRDKIPASIYTGSDIYIQVNGNTSIGVAMGLANKDWVFNNNIISPYGGEVRIIIASSDRFVIQAMDIPKSVCKRFIAAIQNNSYYVGGYTNGSFWLRSLSGYPMSWRQSQCAEIGSVHSYFSFARHN